MIAGMIFPAPGSYSLSKIRATQTKLDRAAKESKRGESSELSCDLAES